MTIGQSIKNGRKRRGFTQRQLGKVVGVSITSVVAWEKGKSAPAGEMLIRLAEELDIRDELFSNVALRREIKEELSCECQHTEKREKTAWFSLVEVWQEIIEWNLDRKMSLLQKIIASLHDMHLRDEVHKNVHPGNILIDDLYGACIQLVDFHPGGTDEHVVSPPEVDIDGVYGAASDIWGFGLLAFKLLTGAKALAKVSPGRKEGEFPAELENCRGVFCRSLDAEPGRRPLGGDIHREIAKWRGKRSLRENDRRLDLNFKLLTHDGEIFVGTELGIARLYVEKQRLLQAKYGKISGPDVLKELCDKAQAIHFVEVAERKLESEAKATDKWELRNFLRQQERHNALLAKRRKKVAQAQIDVLGIEELVECRAPGCKSGKTWQVEDLATGADIFLYGNGNRYQLKPWCRNCMVKRAKSQTRQLSPEYQGYNVAYLGGNYCAEFYLGLRGGDARFFNLYLKPSGLKKKTWLTVLARIQRGSEILESLPSTRFIHSRRLKPLQRDERNARVFSWDYFPSITLRQMLDCDWENSDFGEQVKYTILLEVARALKTLHRNGAVHRNVNPSSILVGVGGQTRLGDFSLCKYQPGFAREDFYAISQNITRKYPAGVLNYIAPEHLDNMNEVDERADIWSWATVACELFTSTSPFKRNRVEQTITAIREEKPNLASLPASLKALVQNALRKKPVERPDSGQVVDEMWKLL